MDNKELIIEELNKIKEKLERRIKRAEVKKMAMEKIKDNLSQYGYWDLGYHQGAAAAYDNALEMIEDVLNLLKEQEEK